METSGSRTKKITRGEANEFGENIVVSRTEAAMTSVCEILDSEHGVHATPGAKCECPECGRKTMSVRRDDTVAKCFHPSCGFYVVPAKSSRSPGRDLQSLLRRVAEELRAALVEKRGAEGACAHDYFTVRRKVDARVLAELDLGVVPRGFDLEVLAAPILDELDRVIAQAETKKEAGANLDDARDRRAELASIVEDLTERLKKVEGWIAFFHSDQYHRIGSIRFRDPCSDEGFQSYSVPGLSNGVFGYSYWKEGVASPKPSHNTLIVVEGEFNLLTLLSLVQRIEDQAPPSNVDYRPQVVAMGSASSPDVGTLKAILDLPDMPMVPTVIRDHDDSGLEMVKRMNDEIAIDEVVPPSPDSDIDDFIRGFGGDAEGALRGVRELLAKRKRRPRPIDLLSRSVFRLRQKQDGKDVRRPFEINAAVAKVVIADLSTRGRLYYDAHEVYFFWSECSLLVRLSAESRERTILLGKYGLNSTESVFNFLIKELEREAFENGTRTTVRRFCYFDASKNLLYLSNLGSKIYVIAENRIELVDNGTDGVIFLPSEREEPFALKLDGSVDRKLFEKVILDKINLKENRFLEAKQLRRLFFYWGLGLFFGELLPTRPIVTFVGARGSGKSMTLRRLGMLLYGSAFQVKQIPSKVDAFDAVVTSSHFAAFDNGCASRISLRR